MLDIAIQEQLKSVFAKLDGTVDFVYEPSEHPSQAELVEFITDIAATSARMRAKSSGAPPRATPHFHLEHNGKATPISFTGIPSGHEFTSLIVAILQTDGKGKFPDDSILARIKRLKGPISLRTIMSLTCENCPDVVQALNMMSLVHADFKHETVDGGYIQDELTALGVQGVPSVIAGELLIHSGRIALIDLLAKLEEHFGVNEGAAQNADLGDFDVAVIGGGPAGASAAIYSVRKGLKTILIAEKMGGQVQETKGIENMISVPYTEGIHLTAQLNQHLGAYPVKVLEHRRVSKIETGESTIVHLEGGEHLRTNQIIIATGAKWRELNIPGEKEYLGRGVAFCPHCDGPYYKGKDIAVIGGGNSGVEAAIDLSGIVKSVVVVEYNDSLKADAVLVNKLLSLPNARIVTNARTKEVLGDGQKVNTLVYTDTKTKEDIKITLDGVFVQIGLLPNSQFVKGVVETNQYGEIIVDAKGHTSVPGIYAAGDVTTVPFKQIVIAMGDGAKVALTAFEDRMHA
jgi:alkyl hydroperoxide reductase subunit F